MLSLKKTVYIIDALNFTRSFMQTEIEEEENTLSEMVSWLADLAKNRLSGSNFRLIIDGSYRPIGPTKLSGVDALFSEEETADEIILEQAIFLQDNGVRVCVVTSDMGLSMVLKERGIKVLGCAKFFKTLS